MLGGAGALAQGRILEGRKIVVLGAAGFIGSATLPALKDAGARVVGVDVSAIPDAGFADEWVVTDIAGQPLPEQLFVDTDAVIHLAWNNDPGRGNSDFGADAASNVAASAKIFQQAAMSGVRRIVYASSGGTVYGRAPTPTSESVAPNPIGGYGAGKAAAELYLMAAGAAYGVETCILRISNPYGPGQRPNRGQGFVATALARTIAQTPIELFGSDQIARDYIFIDDLVQAIVLAVADSTPSALWNIGSGTAVTLANVLDIIFQVVGYDTVVHRSNQRSMDCDKVQLDVSKAKRSLGWEPMVSMADGIARTLAWQMQVRENQP